MIDTRVASLMDEVRLDASGVDDVTLLGADPVLASRFPIGEAAAATLAACGAGAAHVHAMRTGETQSVAADVRHAAASLISYLLQRTQALAGVRPGAAGIPLVSMYPTKDGRWVHLHGAFPRLADPTKSVLGIDTDEDRGVIGAAVAKWDAIELEDALADVRTCGAMIRTPKEWRSHDQGVALEAKPRVELVKVADSAPQPFASGVARPLDGVRVLDLTRMLAGPACGRVLAEHGADVLAITAPDLHNPLAFVVDTGHGKRSAFLDLETSDDVERLRALVRDADVFVQGFRTGALARRGFSPEQLAEMRPGIVCVSINCYGHEGPFTERPGWEQLAQSVAGIAAQQGSEDRPKLLPAAACDYTTGYLGALGTIAALARRANEGGSWHVRVSLARTAMWFDDLGATCDPDAASGTGDRDTWMDTRDTAYGSPVTFLRPVVQMSKTPARWELPTAPLGSHAPSWT